MTLTRLLLFVAALAIGIMLWRYVRGRDYHRDSYECQMLGGNVAECMKGRGWGIREAVRAEAENLRRRN